MAVITTYPPTFYTILPWVSAGQSSQISFPPLSHSPQPPGGQLTHSLKEGHRQVSGVWCQSPKWVSPLVKSSFWALAWLVEPPGGDPSSGAAPVGKWLKGMSTTQAPWEAQGICQGRISKRGSGIGAEVLRSFQLWTFICLDRLYLLPVRKDLYILKNRSSLFHVDFIPRKFIISVVTVNGIPSTTTFSK